MKAFGLVEVLVSTAILVFVIVGIYGVSSVGNISYSTDMGFLDLHQNARQAMYSMTRELRESSAGGIDIDYVDGDDDTITFDTPNETGIQYYRDAQNRIIREYPAGTTKILANDITSLQFSLSGQLLDIRLVASKTALGKDLSFPLKVKVHLRNE